MENMFAKQIYINRRKKLKTSVGSGLILFLGNEETSMNYKDNFYPFRQDSSFLYFFGIDRPGVSAAIDIDQDKEILFGEDPTLEQMVWTGFRESLQVQAEKTGILLVKSMNDFEPLVRKARNESQQIHFLPPYRLEHIEKMCFVLGVLPDLLPKMVSETLIKSIIVQRSLKSSEEVEQITKAVNVSVDMQLTAMTIAKEGMTECRIAGEIHGIAIAAGGNLSFPTILTMNGQILHNSYSNTLLRKGSMVLCDCGAETAMHYAGDLTRTFPVSSSFNTIQRELYDIVLHAHQAAVQMLKPGILFKDVHLHACEILTKGLQQLGIMKGDAGESVAQGAHALFFPCGLGHMMGLDTHDMENLGERYVGYNDEIKQSTQFGLKSLRLAKVLETGFVVTVEPGLYLIPELIDQRASENRFRSFINYEKLKHYKSLGGIRVEEDFLITSSGSLLLGKPLPKTTKEIETLRNI